MLASLTSDYDSLFGASTNDCSDCLLESITIQASDEEEEPNCLTSNLENHALSSPEMYRGRASQSSTVNLCLPYHLCLLENYCANLQTIGKTSVTSVCMKNFKIEELKNKSSSTTLLKSHSLQNIQIPPSFVPLNRSKSEKVTLSCATDKQTNTLTYQFPKRWTSKSLTTSNRSWLQNELNAESFQSNSQSSVSPVNSTKLQETESLLRRRKELSNELNCLHRQLLNSLHEEWLLTGIFPEEFEELHSHVLDCNFKSTSFPFTHLLRTSDELKKMHTLTIKNNGTDKQKDEKHEDPSYTSSLYSSFSSNTDFPIDTLMPMKSWERKNSSYESAIVEDGLAIKNSHNSIFPTTTDYDSKLASLEQDYAVVSQLYKVHRQRAAETPWAAYKTAYKSNAQKMRELTKQIEMYREQKHHLDTSTKISSLERSNSLCLDSFNKHSNTDYTILTMPRKKSRRITSRQEHDNARNDDPSIMQRSWKQRITKRLSVVPVSIKLSENSQKDNLPEQVNDQVSKVANYVPKIVLSNAYGSLTRRFTAIKRHRKTIHATSQNKTTDNIQIDPFLLPSDKMENESNPNKNQVWEKHLEIERQILEKNSFKSSKIRHFFSSLNLEKTEILITPLSEDDKSERIRRSKSFRESGVTKILQTNYSHALLTRKNNETPNTAMLEKQCFKTADVQSKSQELFNPNHSKLNQTDLLINCAPCTDSFRSSSGCYSLSSHLSSQVSSKDVSTSEQTLTLDTPKNKSQNEAIDVHDGIILKKSNVHIRQQKKLTNTYQEDCTNHDTHIKIPNNSSSIRCICSCTSELRLEDNLSITNNCICQPTNLLEGNKIKQTPPASISSLSSSITAVCNCNDSFSEVACSCSPFQQSLMVISANETHSSMKPSLAQSKELLSKSLCKSDENLCEGNYHSNLNKKTTLIRNSLRPMAFLKKAVNRNRRFHANNSNHKKCDSDAKLVEMTAKLPTSLIKQTTSCEGYKKNTIFPITASPKIRRSLWQRTRESLLPSR